MKRKICSSTVLFLLISCSSVQSFPKSHQHIQSDVNEALAEPKRRDEKLVLFHFPNPRPDIIHAIISGNSSYSSDELVPDFNKLIMMVDADKSLSPEQIIAVICQALSRIAYIPLNDIKVSKFDVSTGLIKIFFVQPIQNEVNRIKLKPASEVVPKLRAEDLEKEMSGIRIISLKVGQVYTTGSAPLNAHDSSFKNSILKPWQLAVILSCFVLALCFVFSIAFFISTRRADKEDIGSQEERQVIVQPVLKPDVTDVNVIQPESRGCFIGETDSDHSLSPGRSPIKIKGKGLLERRGSNASLTLDLNRSQENIHCGTPPKECSAEEYLQSAGNRLTRKQLRNCLKEVKSLHGEFWEIPMNHPEKVEVAGSGTKNRYKTILPNELTRVQMQSSDDDPLSSYINANYIRGYSGEQRAYIATQGPMAHTVDDFWEMIWEQKSPAIIMITKLKEKLKAKCEPYIPDGYGKYRNIEVTVRRMVPRDGFIIRELVLKNGKETHFMYHFWYTAWPDHKTPDTGKQLLDMALEVEALRHNVDGSIKGPIIVHCSAGIGRTGCFIAVSIGIQQLREENMVDVLGIVCGLRIDRGGMVQTAEQYEFVHQVLTMFESSILDQSGE